MAYTKSRDKINDQGKVFDNDWNSCIGYKDQSVTVLENIDHEVYQELVEQEDAENIQCKINEGEVHFGAINQLCWCENTIDWNYGY